ncbi:hypothetical protein FB45DRAFT_887392, partial [Roridomyces roridus]
MPNAHRSPYRFVNVIGMMWEGHNNRAGRGAVKNDEEEFDMVMNAFRNYGFGIHKEHIPQRASDRFARYLQDRLDHFDSRGLVILYYQGHGSLDRHNELVLHSGNGSHIRFQEIGNAILSARVDVLMMLNCCHAGAALHTPWQPRNNINYENHVKDIIMAVPANQTTAWGRAEGFAAALEQALREKHNTWPDGFRGTPEHWAKAISRIMRRNVGARHLVAYPRGRSDQPIVVAR